MEWLIYGLLALVAAYGIGFVALRYFFPPDRG
jgi:hypothetical protein